MALSVSAQSVGDLDLFFRSVTDGRATVVREGLRQNPEWANAELFSGIRPVYRAAVLNREDVVIELIAVGADVNVKTDRGTSALHAAAQNGNEKIFDRLIAAGAKPDEANDAGQTPLQMAVRYRHPQLVRKLLELGADPSKADALGRTPLHYGAGMGLLEPVKLLLDKNAALDPVDSEGFTPLGWCRTLQRNEFESVSQLLQARGAKDLRPESAWAKPESPAAPGAGKIEEPKTP